MRKLIDHFKSLGKKLVTLRDTPHAIAGGVAIGVFIGFTPLFGVKTLLSLGVAYLLRCNRIAAVIAVCLHDVLAPLWPVLLRLEYDIGFWLLNNPHHFPPKMEMHHIHIGDMLKWTTFFDVGLPLLIGSLVLAAPAAALFYFVLLAILKAREARHLASRTEAES
ncbi:MAG TPA: DUF2062 domain-containing protein [Terrimicrobiaceae bacterium]